MNDFCPQCGTARVGAFRFCRSCRLDFDTVDEISGAAPTSHPGLAYTEAPDQSATQTYWVSAAKPTVGAAKPKRRVGRYALIGVAAVLGLSGISALAAPRVPDPPRSGAAAASSMPSTAEVTSAAANPTSIAPDTMFGPTGVTQVGTVTRIVDGDTIHVVIAGVDYSLRYIGMDTPEPDSKDPAIKRLATAATAANAALVEGREVTLERDVSETDRYDRLLRNVWIKGADGAPLLVNLELVRLGFAQLDTFPPDVKYVDLLTQAQDVARTAEIGMWASEPNAAPTSTALALTNDEPQSIVSTDRARFRGHVGTYTWSALAFVGDRVTVRWSASAASAASCRVVWQIRPDSGDAIKSTVRVKAGESETGNRRYDTAFSGAAFTVKSTCGTWNMSMQGYEAPQALSGGGGSSNCDPSYPGVCIPPYPPDLDCGQISERRFDVVGADPHGFDSDNDGIGCESG